MKTPEIEGGGNVVLRDIGSDGFKTEFFVRLPVLLPLGGICPSDAVTPLRACEGGQVSSSFEVGDGLVVGQGLSMRDSLILEDEGKDDPEDEENFPPGVSEYLHFQILSSFVILKADSFCCASSDAG